MNIQKGPRKMPAMRLLFGAPGTGKTSFALHAEPPRFTADPRVLTLDYDRGLRAFRDAHSADGADTWEASKALVKSALSVEGDYTTVVIDTIDRLVDQCGQTVAKEAGKKHISEIGYQDGYRTLAIKWREFLFDVRNWSELKGRDVTMTAHAARQKIKDPIVGDYSVWGAQMPAESFQATVAWADHVLFFSHETLLSEDGRPLVTGKRLLHTVTGSGFVAKHRPNIEAVLPLSWSAYELACASAVRQPGEVIESILALATTEDLRKKAEEKIEAAAGNVSRLVSIEKALRNAVQQGVGAP